jgi:recombination protein RecA
MKKKIIKTASSISNVVSEYEKQFGKGIFWDFTTNKSIAVPHIPTDSIGLNWLFGVGGVPRGRLVEIYGRESSGKTTFCYHLIKCAQREGLAAYIDSEHSMEMQYAEQCGVDRTKFVFAQPDWGEQAFQMIEGFITDKRFSIVVLDSVVGLAPKAEADGEVGDQYMGLVARMVSQAMRRLSPILKQSKAVIVFTNQVRKDFSGYGDPDTTGGGMSLRHTVQVKIKVSKRDKIIRKGIQEGFFSEFKAVKNKVATPFRIVQVPILFGQGIATDYELITLGVKSKVIRKKPSSYRIGNRSLGRDWMAAHQAITQNSKIKKFLLERIVKYLESTSL